MPGKAVVPFDKKTQPGPEWVLTYWIPLPSGFTSWNNFLQLRQMSQQNTEWSWFVWGQVCGCLQLFCSVTGSDTQLDPIDPPSKPQEMMEIGWFSYSFDAYLDARPFRIIINNTSKNSVMSVNFILSYNPRYCMISCGNPPERASSNNHSTPFQMMVVASSINLMV